MPGTTEFILPDLTTIVPFRTSCNHHHPKASAESEAWINSFDVLNAKAKQGMIALAASYMYPDAGFGELRTGCDLINVITALDEISDVQDGGDAQHSTDAFIAAISGKPDTPTDLHRLVSQFRERVARKAFPNCMSRFVESSVNYCDAVAQEAELREHGCTLDIDSFTKLRWDFSSAQLCISLIEYVHGIDIPDVIYDNDTFRQVYWAGVDMLCLTNDLYSFNREQAKGIEINNMITVAIKEMGYTLQQAADFIGDEHRRLVAQMLDASARMPSFGENVDVNVQKFVRSVEQCVAGNILWCLESPRYFGVWSAPLERDRVVRLWGAEV